MCMKVNNKNKYNQLTSEERDKIAILRAQGKSLTLIASMIGRNKSTISREWLMQVIWELRQERVFTSTKKASL